MSNVVHVVVRIDTVSIDSDAICMDIRVSNETTNDMRISRFGLWNVLQRTRFGPGDGRAWSIKPAGMLWDPADDEIDYSIAVRSRESVRETVVIDGTLSARGTNEVSIVGETVRYIIDWHLDSADMELRTFSKNRCWGSGNVEITRARTDGRNGDNSSHP